MNQAKGHLDYHEPQKLKRRLNDIGFSKEKSISNSPELREPEMFQDSHPGLMVIHNEEEKQHKNGFKYYMALKSYDEHKKKVKMYKKKQQRYKIIYSSLNNYYHI